MPTMGHGKTVLSERDRGGEEEAEEEIRRPEQTKKEEGLRQRRKRSLSTALSFPSTTHTPTPKVLICWELNSTARVMMGQCLEWQLMPSWSFSSAA